MKTGTTTAQVSDTQEPKGPLENDHSSELKLDTKISPHNPIRKVSPVSRV